MTESPLTGHAAEQMVTTLIQVREALRTATLPLEIPDVDLARTARNELIDQLEDYVLPRLIQVDAPLLTVVGGSTGAGKSTLVNSLVGARVTEPGVLRPTTRSPVLVHNPADAHWFEQARILPDLKRTTHSSADPGSLQLVSSPAVPAGLAVLDAPDIDSVEEQNRTLAAQLLGAADLWLFVTSAARYADQVPWEYLKSAADRSAAVAIVLDRTAPSATEEVSAHLARMLTARGLRDSPLFIVAEGEVDEDGLLPSLQVREIRAWLGSLAADADARTAIVRQTLQGAIRTLSNRTYQVADACFDQFEIQARLRRDSEAAYEAALVEIDHASSDGTLLQGEVLLRWQELVGEGELKHSLDSKVGWLRDRVAHAVKGQPRQADLIDEAVTVALRALVREQAEAAAERTAESWRAITAGRQLLDAAPADLSQASVGLRGSADRAVREWQQVVHELVRAEGNEKRPSARFLAYGANALASTLTVVVLGSPADRVGPGVAGGAAVLGEKLLESVFGAAAVARLVARARVELNSRMQNVLESEQRRYVDLLDELGIHAETEEQLRAGARRIDDLRFGTSAG